MSKNTCWILIIVVISFWACNRNDSKQARFGKHKIQIENKDTLNFFNDIWVYTSFRLNEMPGRLHKQVDESYQFEFDHSSFKINGEIAGKWKLFRIETALYIQLQINNTNYKRLIFNDEQLKLHLYDLHPQLFDAVQFFKNENGKILSISHHFLRKEEAGAFIQNYFPEKE